ncbi:hypothetical protein FACUT_5774 [Fusarium acutatum]|uniref:Uncharacterized protein n=1 Tax=Fusarium acutatum TaxID=78861 RepID=A0A8H4JTF8_9HYPO|nr:hypothetical protein FACUT_5774 [Fusarium acutatum]
MSKESQDRHSMKEGTMEIELELRAASRAGTAPEAGNGTAELGHPQAGTDNGNDKTSIMSSKKPGSTGQGAQSSPNVPGSMGQVAEGDMEPPRHPNQEVVDQNVHLADLTDETLLPGIRNMLILGLRCASLDRARLVGDNSPIRGLESRWIRDAYGAESSEIREPFHWSDNYIGDAWPESQDVAE